MPDARSLPDQKAGLAALTELDYSLLVEAGAGSGKTSIMAGRVAMLFARSVEPSTSPPSLSPCSPQAS
jgi:superfamily I DNA/RNA helicase